MTDHVEKGLVQDWVPPQAPGSQSFTHPFQGATESSKKKSLLKMSEGGSAGFFISEGFKQTIDISTGLNRFKDF